ncbi:hypothetical protein PV328_009087 [Microctonus aethiopoides]|uniref:Disease resistance R13L4/SHOC-2-like LRR domain-containing protein n=1 Tax=Microctonus aethiopoides TaxID=144406 RepID=A0AA39FKY6_9HYME|nr:hypothetical protein PV328_009087 [Microctonus aethiopoides]
MEMEIDQAELVKEIKNKTILHWNYRDYEKLPESLKHWGIHVQELYLKENKLSSLPQWINQLSNITNLYLSGNKFITFPHELSIMTRLTVLDLSDNNIKILPACIQNLKSIKDLNLDGNCLHQLPLELSQLQCLETLSISRNNFVILPEWIGSLIKLERLFVDNNCLEELPNRLTLLSSLNTISICANRLKYLPLNSFISPVNIRFNCNPNLNYLSYSVLSQLLESGWEDEKNKLPATNENITSYSTSKKNIKLEVIINSVVTREKHAIIELPRQLMNIFGIDCKVPVSLWELSLRTLYKNKYENSLDEYHRYKHDICYNLMTNGPTSICLNNQCQEPIFTEAWIIIGRSEECRTFLVITFFCSHRCAHNFDIPSHGIDTLSWDFYKE